MLADLHTFKNTNAFFIGSGSDQLDKCDADQEDGKNGSRFSKFNKNYYPQLP